MTDNEIIKAWECCKDKYNCPSCPLLEDTYCDITLAKHSLNLINRQKAEIEKLREHIELLDIEHEAIEISAVKKFAERLKEKKQLVKASLEDIGECLLYGVLCGDIDNLVKEMVGAENEQK